MDKILGKTLAGRYLVEELIGVGGMANVYKGFDTKAQRPVAIKMLRDEYAKNEDFLRRFRNETRAIDTLNHPNIVKIYDVILGGPNPTIVMEYVDGITLKEYIEKKKVVSFKVATALTIQLLMALQHAHDNGIVHRDVKPQNIMVLTDGSIKVMDFGIARFAMSRSRTITNKAIGSVHYISPEQARGDGVIDQRSDLYSVGVILFEMITGQLPFEGDSPITVALKQIEASPVKPRQLNPAIPQALEDITLRAMAKNVDKRYQSAGEMLQDLRSFTQNPGIVFGYGEMDLDLDKKSEAQKFMDREEASAVTDQKTKKTKKGSDPAARRRKKKKKASFLSILFGITCAFVVGTLIFVGVMVYNNNPFVQVPEVECPDLVGKQYDEVIKDKAYSDFEFVLEEQDFRNNFEQGEIYEQYPTSGKNVKVGSTIRLKVSNGQQTVPMPDFTGQEGTLVMAKLQEMGLVAEETQINSEDVPEGSVVSTEPGPNVTVEVGSSVMVYVSRGSGKEKVRVPDVVGQDLETAREIIKNAGLEVGTIIRKASDMAEGVVLNQDPNYPAPLAVGSKVNLTVSSELPVSEGEKSVSIICMLPLDIEQSVHLTVDQDGVEFLNQMVSPAEARVVNITVPGDSGQTTITVKINDKVYHSYRVDFDPEKPTYEDLEDNSEGFQP
ncbi:Stk1 family PASTA domain-containing Ser/Thr kinase [Angelakisella massiliensis]|uniref:Stk1 family PASTA domain-containing Ser/Thr kinase n=1 Tax=Angelakisella massiliensis TaxID=1871018 RepID=UPI0023A7F602|nr:Stk1 family PASTA domain-containing Ser/Thr kinase [Angelakisella massiliensis]